MHSEPVSHPESPGSLSPLQDAMRAREVAARHRLMLHFHLHPREDSPEYRRLIREALEAIANSVATGIEFSCSWYLLASVTIDPRERIGYLARAIDAMESGREAQFVVYDELSRASALIDRSGYYFEIGLIHARHGNPATAEDFFRRALSLAEEAEHIREITPVEPIPEDELEEPEEEHASFLPERPSIAEEIRAALERLPDVEPEPPEGFYTHD